MPDISSNLKRSLKFRANSFDAEARTVEVIVSTGAAVRRSGYVERLVISDEAIKLDRLREIGTVLDSHEADGLDRVLGSVDDVWIEGGHLIARIRFSERAEAIARDVEAGIIRSVSVGYMVHDYEVIERGDGELPVFNVTSWEPYEISFVAIPADPGAQVRSAEESQVEAVAEDDQAEETTATEPAADAAPVPVVDSADADADEIEEAPAADPTSSDEKPKEQNVYNGPQVEDAAKRAAEIVVMAVAAGVPALAADAIQRGLSLDDAKRLFEGVGVVRDLCKRAGRPQLADQFVAERRSVDEVRAALLDALLRQAEAEDVSSHIAPVTEATSTRKANPLNPSSIYGRMNANSNK